MPEWWEALTVGTLVDGDIKAFATKGSLITSEFKVENVRQACYELRASDIFYETATQRENKRMVVREDIGYILRPHSYVTCIVKERIQLPPNVLARIMTKGQLFSIGISPVNTYADPGFAGRLGITLVNFSHRYITIKPGQSIAKIEFTVLPKVVDEPYAGVHGYESEMWPVPTHLYSDVDKARRGGWISDEVPELRQIYGDPIAEMYWRLRFFTGVGIFQILLTVVLFVSLFAFRESLSLWQSVFVGLGANIITTVGAHILGRVGWHRRSSAL